jgi:hypothetical protein
VHLPPKHPADLGAGRYEEQYVKVGGEWKFKRLKLISSFWRRARMGERAFYPRLIER